MLDNFFTTTLSMPEFSISNFLICTVASVILGVIIALFFMFRNTYTKGFIATIAVIPIIVQVIIMMVNGNIGAGVAVAGAFSLVRFRSAPGTAREICYIFLAMATGLATGMAYTNTAYLIIAVLLVLVVGLLTAVYQIIGFGSPSKIEKHIRIVIPEELDYTSVFDDIMKKYTVKYELIQAKTTNMGSLFRLTYHVTLKNASLEKQFVDELRVKNGNLEIICGDGSEGSLEL